MLGRAVIDRTQSSVVAGCRVGSFGRAATTGAMAANGGAVSKLLGAADGRGGYRRVGGGPAADYGAAAGGSGGGDGSLSDPERGAPASRPPPARPADRYGVADAYRWLYDALRRQPPATGLPATGAALVAVAGESLLVSLPALYLGDIVDVIAAAGAGSVGAEAQGPALAAAAAPADAWPLFGLIALSLVGKEVCTVARKYVVERQSTALEKGAFLDQATHLLAVRVDALQDRRVGDLAVRLDKSVAGLIKLMKVTFLQGLPNFGGACVALSLAYHTHWVVGLATAGCLAAGGLVTAAQIRSQEGIRVSLNEQKAALGGSIAEMLGNLAYIRASGMREAEEGRLADGAERLRRTEFAHHKYMMSFGGAKDLIEGLGYALVVGVAIRAALAGEISTGDILTLSVLYKNAAQPMSKMHPVFDGMHEAVIKIGALSAVRDLPSDPGLAGTERTRADAMPMEAQGLGVTFSRGGASGGVEARVLDGLTLDLRCGTVVGLAGTSGSGKSTLLKVALGLIPDYDGSMKMFGAEIRDLQKLELSQNIAYAQQEPFVLTGTLRENLLLAQPSGLEDALALDDAALLVALARSCLGPADHHWAHGLDTHIHEGGRNLSGGQRQRLALARVFLQRRARLIVLDEATSALDNATEARVIRELHAHAADAGRTVVMVAHRLTTLRNADRVLVMDGGRVVQDGGYDELSRTPGIFFDLLQYNNKGI